MTITFNIEISAKAKHPVTVPQIEGAPDKLIFNLETVEYIAATTVKTFLERQAQGDLWETVLENLKLDPNNVDVSDYLELKVNGKVIK